ncbi:MAG: tetratricopeptide repeat protein [Calditrichia bacterium]
MASKIELADLERLNDENSNSIVFAALAAKYIEMGLVDKALSIASRGVDKYPDYAYGQYVLALCHYNLNDYAKAKSRLEVSLALDDKNPRGWKLASDVNEQMNLPLLADECRMHYFLHDSFNTDAVELFQKHDAISFTDFEADPSISVTNETGPYMNAEPEPEMVEVEEITDSTIDLGFTEDTEPEADLDQFFDDVPAEEEINISQKVEEVFKETLGDMSIETTLDDFREPQDVEDVSIIDASIIDEDDDSTREADSGEVEQDLLDMEDQSRAIDVNKLFSEFEVGETPDEALSMSETTDLEDVSAPAVSTEDETYDQVDDDFLDFSSVVEEIISERDDETRGGIANASDLEAFESDDDSITFEALEVGDDSITFEALEIAEEASEINAIPAPQEEEEDVSFESLDLTDDSIAFDLQDVTDENITLEDFNIEEEDSVTLDEDDVQDDNTYEALSPDGATSEPQDNTTRFGRPPILSPTLGEIYIAQGRFEEAIEVFQQLLEKDPGNQRFQKKINDIQAMLDKQRSN